jgi:uncharacterized protein (DUF1800 family)
MTTLRPAVPTAYERHVMNRVGWGFSRATYADLRRAGGADAWLKQQLEPTRIRENARTKAVATSWFPDLKHDAEQRWKSQQREQKGGWEYALDLSNQSLLRRIYTRRQLLEAMVDFWSDHLHVPGNHDTAWLFRSDYDELLRRHALGRFDDLLVAASLHPAMILHLDTWTSTRRSPNENHGRELLELHTVGRAAGYTEAMVKDSARILSGYTIDAWKTWRPSYDSKRHATGPVHVLGFRHDNAAADGRPVAEAYLRHLAQHPATARRIAHKLAVRFVSDRPSAALVDQLTRTFRSSGTDIRATMRVLLASREFKRAVGAKVRTPDEDVVATCRALAIRVRPPRRSESFARSLTYVQGGLQLYDWPRPDGPPDSAEAWSSVTRMFASYRMHWNIAAGWWPTLDVTHRPSAYWLPKRGLPTKGITMAVYVDRVCRLLLGRASTPHDRKVVAQATGVPLRTRITPHHAVARWDQVRVLGALLDSPGHMTR